MKKLNHKKLLFFVSFLLLQHVLFVNKVLALNGFYPISFGSHKSLGGAGAALPIEVLNVESNPALIGLMPNHMTVLAGLPITWTRFNSAPALIGNKIAGSQSNILKYNPYGGAGFCYRLSDNWTFGVGGGGANLGIKYDRSIDAFNTKFNRRYMQFLGFVLPTVSYSVSCEQVYGASLILSASGLKTDLATSTFPFPETSGHNTLAYTLGIGARVGAFFTITDWLNVGASISTPIKFQKNRRYRDVLPHSIDVPAIARVGFDFHYGDCFHLVFDIKELFWHRVKAFRNLGWRNQTVFAVGVRQNITEKLITNIGYNYGRSPIRNNNVFLNALGFFIMENHFCAGLTYAITECVDLDFSACYVPEKRVVDNGKGKLGPNAAGAVLKTHGYELQLMAIIRF